ncbi:MAG: ABC transporter ATP-binding protein [Chromatiaceae bacterium]|nr:ABC transporter ATP-binding protein [Chromatiaceae bacterium]
MDEVLIKAEHVSKKFCRSLKRSLWYGAQDVTRSLLPWTRQVDAEISADPDADYPFPALRTDEFWALKDISFEVRRGECLGLIGHNGAGKSTLLKILNRLIRPDTGRITIRGRVGALIELSAGFNPILSGRENIYNRATLFGFSKSEIDRKFDAIVDFAEIEDFLDMPVQNYSSGMQVKLGFAVSAQMEPDILIVDEVLAVGDVGFRFKCLNAMADLMNRSAVIFVSHSMPQVFRVATQVTVLNRGRVIISSTDVGKGVDHYLSEFNISSNIVAGSGQATLGSFHMESQNATANKGEMLRVAHGGAVTFHVGFQVDPGIPRIRIQIVVWNMEMLPVMDIMDADRRGYAVDVPNSGGVKVSARVDHIFLNGGKYILSAIAIAEDQSRIYCRDDRVGNLFVEATAASWAHTLVPAVWNLDN